MPNTRRRRFSVQHDIAGRNTPKTSHPENESDFKIMTQNIINMKSTKRSKMFPNSSKNTKPLEIVAECDSNSTVVTVREQSSTTTEKTDKTVTASSSNIDICNFLTGINNPSIESVETTALLKETGPKNRRQSNRDGMPRREKPRQHRVKVRSPKRRVSSSDGYRTDDTNMHTVGVNAIDWDEEVMEDQEVTNIVEINEEEEDRRSNHSNEDMCRICHSGDALSPDLGLLISACSCRGTVGRVHVKCLERWLTESGKSRCELCGTRYTTRRVHRYGVPRALIMWVLSQNAKQLMVDSLGIMLMSPLAILAAWLSGRTLAGLMAQDSHVTPWPLASTFVLACMTLVCYYCWIVSAATRHALGWWIWYRSQYEVRLQFQNTDE